MERLPTLSVRIKDSRKKQGLSQAELAEKCNLNIRTIQRTENGEVFPRLHTLKILEEALGIDLLESVDFSKEREQNKTYMHVFRVRKRIRIIGFVFALLILLAALILILTGIPKIYWAPFVYFFMFAYIIVMALTWRCPSCNSILGDVFNTTYCQKCGLKFKELSDDRTLY